MPNASLVLKSVTRPLSDIIVKAILGAIARHGGDLPGLLQSQLQAGLGGLSRVPGVVVRPWRRNVPIALPAR